MYVVWILNSTTSFKNQIHFLPSVFKMPKTKFQVHRKIAEVPSLSKECVQQSGQSTGVHTVSVFFHSSYSTDSLPRSHKKHQRQTPSINSSDITNCYIIFKYTDHQGKELTHLKKQLLPTRQLCMFRVLIQEAAV